jgi:hypothetical protein
MTVIFGRAFARFWQVGCIAGRPRRTETRGQTERFQEWCRARRELVLGALAGLVRRRVVAEIS